MKCGFIKVNKKACRAFSLKGEEYCYLHNPGVSLVEKKEAQSRGGKAHLDEMTKLDPIDLTDPKMILYLLADTINRVRRVRLDGSMDIKTANSIGHLASKMLEAQRVIVLGDRLTEFEEKKVTQSDISRYTNDELVRIITG